MFPPQLTSLIETVARDVEPLADDMPGVIAKAHGAIALMGDIGGVWILRPDGAFLQVDWDSEKPPQPLAEPECTRAIAAGAERYPWLSTLLPGPPTNARACMACRGEGRIRLSADRTQAGILCGECNALGWTVPSRREQTSSPSSIISDAQFTWVQLDAAAHARRDQSSFHVLAEGMHADLRAQIYSLAAGDRFDVPSDRWPLHAFLLTGLTGTIDVTVAHRALVLRQLSQLLILPGVPCALTARSEASVQIVSVHGGAPAG